MTAYLNPCAVCTAAFLLAALGTPGVAATKLSDVVPDYMPGELETAIVPTPRQANLEETCRAITAPIVCVLPDVLMRTQEALDESGALLLPEGRERTRGLQRVSRSVARPNWPDPVGVVTELRELFPDATFARKLPPVNTGTVILMHTRGRRVPRGFLKGVKLSAPDTDDPDTAAEAYMVAAGTQGGQTRIAIVGASPWGMLWGLETLRQMIFHTETASYVREGTVRDWPAFWFRGGKRGKRWWVRFKGNASFEGNQWGFARHRLKRNHFWWVKGDKATVDGLRAGLRQAVSNGMNAFIVDYNDGAFRTKEQDDETFPGDPARTVKFLLDSLADEREKIGADVKLGYMPSAYSLGHGAWTEGRALDEAGALDKADLLLHNGLEVWTFRYPPEVAQAYRKAFGFDGDLILYDCQCLRKPLGGLDLEEPDVWRELDGLSLQNAWFVFAITGLDYAWNPQAYDPERSLQLAVREWVQRDPVAYRALYDLVRYFNDNDFVEEFFPREKLLAHERAITAGMVERVEKAVAVVEEHALVPGTADFLADDSIASEIGHRPMRRKAFGDLMNAHGFREYHVTRSTGPITIDGRLDDAAWASVPTMDGFTMPGYAVTDPGGKKGIDSIRSLPSSNRNVVVKAVYDATAVYCAYEITGLGEEALSAITEALAKELTDPARTSHCWRHGPTVELYVDPAFEHQVYWQLLCTVPNEYFGFAPHFFDPEQPYFSWDPKPAFRYRLKDATTLVLETRLPFWPEMEPPTSGDVWSVQLQAIRMFDDMPVVRWSFSYESWARAPFQRYGHWIFD